MHVPPRYPNGPGRGGMQLCFRVFLVMFLTLYVLLGVSGATNLKGLASSGHSGPGLGDKIMPSYDEQDVAAPTRQVSSRFPRESKRSGLQGNLTASLRNGIEVILHDGFLIVNACFTIPFGFESVYLVTSRSRRYCMARHGRCQTRAPLCL